MKHEPIRVLVVDDEAALRMTLAANLELEDFAVAEAGNGAEALRLLDTQQFDIIISDMRMPEMNGLDLVHAIRLRNDAIPIILMSGFENEGMIEQAIELGAFTLLTKPFKVDRLVGVIRRAIRACVLAVRSGDREIAQAARAMQEAGLRVHIVVDESSVNAQLRTVRPDVCLLRLGTRDSAGNSLLSTIRNFDAAVSIIILAGERSGEALQGDDLHSAALLASPFATRDLLNLIAKARGHSEAA